jgi:hypothetical protein
VFIRFVPIPNADQIIEGTTQFLEEEVQKLNETCDLNAVEPDSCGLLVDNLELIIEQFIESHFNQTNNTEQNAMTDGQQQQAQQEVMLDEDDSEDVSEMQQAQTTEQPETTSEGQETTTREPVSWYRRYDNEDYRRKKRMIRLVYKIRGLDSIIASIQDPEQLKEILLQKGCYNLVRFAATRDSCCNTLVQRCTPQADNETTTEAQDQQTTQQLFTEDGTTTQVPAQGQVDQEQGTSPVKLAGQFEQKTQSATLVEETTTLGDTGDYSPQN